MQNQQSLYRQARLARDARFDGLFFVAVKTTGIFCRPVCPAVSPKEENVEYFQYAALAMQSGYRPCLRCRPDSAPNSFAWKGVDTTVERGISLLKQFPQLQVKQIADKLGISDRYFRQLFQHHFGMAPKQYQLFEQLLFAKQLLHQTGLTVEQIAQAAGFKSARRLQQQMRTNTGLSPKQIRQNKRMQNTELQLFISYRPPYAWQQVRAFYQLRAVEGMEQVTDDYYSRTFIFKNVKGRFKATYNAARQGFDLILHLDDLSHLKAVIEEITRLLDCRADTLLIAHQLVLAGIPECALTPGLRLPGVWDTFEAGCRAILGQQVSVKAAIKLLTLLVHHLGEKQDELFFFPTPEQVLASDLAFLPMPNSRRQALLDLAKHLCEGHECTDLNDWQAIKGVGPWTIAYAQMRGQSESDIWLSNDLVVKKQASQMNLMPEQASPWRSYLTFQLWTMATE